MAVTRGTIAFVASKRPPRPTSTTAAATPARAKWQEARERRELEVGEPVALPAPRRATGRRGGSPRPRAASVAVADRRAAHLDPLVEADEVGRGVEADVVTGGSEGGGRHRAGRALAVGAADVEDADRRAPDGRARRARAACARARSASRAAAARRGRRGDRPWRGVARRRRRAPGGRAAQPRSDEELPEPVAQLVPVDDGVDHAVLEEELAPLEARRQLLADGLLDDARARRSR